MDATALGTLLVGLGAVAGAVVTYLGKRGENANARVNSENDRINRELDQVQEERNGLRDLLRQRDERITELLQERLTDQVEITRLRVKIIEMGGQP
jgi:chromosome segregation ATPase